METQKHQRMLGFDVARSLAVFAMVIVNFKIVMGAESAGPSWLVWLTGLLSGRGAATFVVLAGVGLSLMARRARDGGDAREKRRVRTRLLKRAIFLFMVGLLYYPLWPADILHYYGVYLAVAAFLVFTGSTWLWVVAVVLVIAFDLLMLVLNYETGWDFTTLTYLDFWTIEGFFRNLFFNGFHPVIPWLAFILVGLWLGRQDLTDRALRRAILFFSIGTVAVVQGISNLLIRYFSKTIPPANMADFYFLLAAEPMPPTPFYMLAGGGTAVAVIVLSVMFAERFQNGSWTLAAAHTGQLALTLYVAHVVIGMGILEIMGRLENQTLAFSLFCSILFCVLSVLFSTLWKRKFQRGPLEWIMRRLTG